MGFGARSLKWVPCDTQQSMRPWKAGMRRTWGGGGTLSFFFALRVLSELARHEIDLLLNPRGVWIQEVSGVP